MSLPDITLVMLSVLVLVTRVELHLLNKANKSLVGWMKLQEEHNDAVMNFVTINQKRDDLVWSVIAREHPDLILDDFARWSARRSNE
jgi:hypothetical protein